jgi:hypothetical protein
MDSTGPIGARLYPLRRTRDYDGAVTLASADWEGRNAALWDDLDMLGPQEFTARMERLARELPQGDAVGLFERGASFDSTGSPGRAVPLYEAALAAGLGGERRRRAVIQMASSLRNLGEPQRALELLQAEAGCPSDGLDDAVATFTALTLVDLGREREAVGVALTALSAHLPRYTRSVARYAAELTG